MKKKSLSLRFLGSEIHQILTGSSTERLTELKSRCQPTEFSSGVLTKENYISKLPLVVDRICFRDNRLWSPLSCWLSNRDQSHFLQAIHRSLPCGLLNLSNREFLLHHHFLLCKSLLLPDGEISAFEGPMWLPPSQANNLHIVKSIDLGLELYLQNSFTEIMQSRVWWRMDILGCHFRVLSIKAANTWSIFSTCSWFNNVTKSSPRVLLDFHNLC